MGLGAGGTPSQIKLFLWLVTIIFRGNNHSEKKDFFIKAFYLPNRISCVLGV